MKTLLSGLSYIHCRHVKANYMEMIIYEKPVGMPQRSSPLKLEEQGGFCAHTHT